MIAQRYATEQNYLPDWLYHESEGEFSRENVTFLAGSGSARNIKNGTVMGKVATGAATAAAVAGNTGNGTFGTVTVGAGAKVGVYRLTCIKAATNAGEFTMEDPDGIVVGTPVVAVSFTGGGLSFTLADGATDFVVGDEFTITVAAGSGKYVPLDLAGTAGEATPAGIAMTDTVVPDGADVAAAVLVRDARVVMGQLIYPAGATTNQKNAIVAGLSTLRIFSAGSVPV